jgi:o-succinylbenzoate synthase
VFAVIDVRPFRLPLKTPFTTSKGQVTHREGLLVRVEKGGITGWGEASPFPGLSGETLAAANDDLMSVHGAPVPDTPNLRDIQKWVYETVSTPSAAHALGTALADCSAQRAGMSLAHFLSSRSRGEVPISHLFTNDSDLLHAVMLGAQTIKVKTGMVPVPEEIERIRTIRRVAGPDVTFRLDANGAWTEDEALQIIDTLGPLGVTCIEDPVPSNNLGAMARLRGRGVDIAADEGVSNPEALQQIIAHKSADVVVIKPMRLGTPMSALAMIAMADEAGMASFVTTTIDAAVGRMTALHIAAAAPTRRLLACGLNTGSWLEQDLTPTPEMAGSHVSLNQAYGLGLRIQR